MSSSNPVPSPEITPATATPAAAPASFTATPTPSPTPTPTPTQSPTHSIQELFLRMQANLYIFERLLGRRRAQRPDGAWVHQFQGQDYPLCPGIPLTADSEDAYWAVAYNGPDFVHSLDALRLAEDALASAGLSEFYAEDLIALAHHDPADLTLEAVHTAATATSVVRAMACLSTHHRAREQGRI